MNKYHCPEDCESLTEVGVNQAVRDNLSPSAHVRSEDVKMQKVLLCLKAYVPWHASLTNLVTNIPLPVESELFREAIDAFTLLANADTGFNQIKAWRVIQLDLHDDYMHYCSSFIPNTD